MFSNDQSHARRRSLDRRGSCRMLPAEDQRENRRGQRQRDRQPRGALVGVARVVESLRKDVKPQRLEFKRQVDCEQNDDGDQHVAKRRVQGRRRRGGGLIGLGRLAPRHLFAQQRAPDRRAQQADDDPEHGQPRKALPRRSGRTAAIQSRNIVASRCTYWPNQVTQVGIGENEQQAEGERTPPAAARCSAISPVESPARAYPSDRQW